MSETSEFEAEERHLGNIIRGLRRELTRVSTSIDRSVAAVDEQKQFMWEHRRDMDGSEKASMRSLLAVAVSQGEGAMLGREQIGRLLESAYFGRVDFKPAGETVGVPVYIGVHTFRDPDSAELGIHDWRAPVSSLFYDFETGEASFTAPTGEVDGEVMSKRQFKVRGENLEYMFDSALNIGDDVLQRELGQASSDKMHNIVATIQREQNAIIRNEISDVLLLQGVAGSGKTSIALHRVAFLLYRFKEQLNSENVMIISPNRIFGDYIASVLPELGETQVQEISLDELAGRYLRRVVRYQTFYEQIDTLLDGADPHDIERMEFKATPQFVTALTQWIESSGEEFTASSIVQQGEQLAAEWAEENFHALKWLPIFSRLEQLAAVAVQQLKRKITDRHGRWTSADTVNVGRQVAAMFPYKDAYALYKGFYREREQLFALQPDGRLEYADVFPLIYTMVKSSRRDDFTHVRHLIVDEMQDYTPVQYAVLRSLFTCRMTILGDAHQSVNPHTSSSIDTIRQIFPESDQIELHRSYRSTIEITEFAQRISPNDKLIPVDRRGTTPSMVMYADEEQQIDALVELLTLGELSQTGLAVVCKTNSRAKRLHRVLADRACELTLLDQSSVAFVASAVITSVAIAKGLEFDTVVVPDADAATYHSGVDRSMLYIACTRAMHKLFLTGVGTPSRLVADSRDSTAQDE
ncbi:MAG: UvrD-helicase domain-containing protein [Homoserinimonas sp.]